MGGTPTVIPTTSVGTTKRGHTQPILRHGLQRRERVERVGGRGCGKKQIFVVVELQHITGRSCRKPHKGGMRCVNMTHTHPLRIGTGGAVVHHCANGIAIVITIIVAAGQHATTDVRYLKIVIIVIACLTPYQRHTIVTHRHIDGCISTFFQGHKIHQTAALI